MLLAVWTMYQDAPRSLPGVNGSTHLQGARKAAFRDCRPYLRCDSGTGVQSGISDHANSVLERSTEVTDAVDHSQ
jgi:hypothetical protein